MSLWPAAGYTTHMDPQVLIRTRLTSQLLTGNGLHEPAAVVAHLGAMQAQDYPGALWSVGLRVPGSTLCDIETAVARRQIVRTWPMRGTLHFVAAADVRWMVELLGPRATAAARSRATQLGLDEAVFQKCRDICQEVLGGDKQLSRKAICQEFEKRGIATASQRGIHILRHLSEEGLLCFGLHEGKQPTFALLAEWAPQARTLPREAALAKLAATYFGGHGPATLKDFIGWTMLTVADAKLGIELAKDALTTATFDSKTYWFSRKQAVPPKTPDVQLLPGFDEYLLGYKDRTAVLEHEHAQKIVPGNNGMFISTLVIDGLVAGLWRRTPRARQVTVTIMPFRPLTRLECEAAEAAAARYGSFINTPVTTAFAD